MRTESDKPFGHTSMRKFNVGDLVSWKEIGAPVSCMGIIKELYNKQEGSRNVAYAKLLLQKSDTKEDFFCEEEVLIMKLKLLSKHKKETN
tara:strand:+ start:699 stop:968 length:270 start_codon:yes stop_codon:yes gene_type:complete